MSYSRSSATLVPPPPAEGPLTLSPEALAVAAAAREGLSAFPKWLPAWLFYDAEGSELFERITTLPEYYLTRTEREILAGSAESMIASALQQYLSTGRARVEPRFGSGGLRIVELGAGTASKTGILLRAATHFVNEVQYVPVDVSISALEQATHDLAEAVPQVKVTPKLLNYVADPLLLPHHSGPTLALYIGSSIGNFSPAEARGILTNLQRHLAPGDGLLLGTDLKKNVHVLEAAYTDSSRVTEAFNLNVLRRLNRELGADFDLDAFRHAAFFNAEASRMEMHLRSTTHQRVSIPSIDLNVSFLPGETIHTENSYKFTKQSVSQLLDSAGFQHVKTWSDDRGWFAVTLASLKF